MFLKLYLHSDEAHAGAECPGQEAGAGLGVGPHVVLAVDAGQVHGAVVELGGNHQLGGHGGWSLVYRANICFRERVFINISLKTHVETLQFLYILKLFSKIVL